MPQMAPINWLLLFILFIIMFFIFIILNYFSFIYKPKELKKKTNKLLLAWKW